MKADWARACPNESVVFFVAQYLSEFGQPPHQTDSDAKNIYMDAVTKVPDYAQDDVLSIADLSEKANALVKTMAGLRNQTVTVKHVRKYARDVAKVMWKSKAFRKRLAAYWDSEEMLRQLELEALDNYEKKTESSKPTKQEIMALHNRKQRLMERIEFCERRSVEAGCVFNKRENGEASGSDGELASEAEEEEGTPEANTAVKEENMEQKKEPANEEEPACASESKSDNQDDEEEDSESQSLL